MPAADGMAQPIEYPRPSRRGRRGTAGPVWAAWGRLGRLRLAEPWDRWNYSRPPKRCQAAGSAVRFWQGADAGNQPHGAGRGAPDYRPEAGLPANFANQMSRSRLTHRNPRHRPQASGGRPLRNELRHSSAGPTQLRPRSAHTPVAVRSTGFRARLVLPVEALLVPVPAPLPPVPGHVVQTERGHPESLVHGGHRHGRRAVRVSPAVPAVAHPVRGGEPFAPGEWLAPGPPGGVLPQCLGRQETLGPAVALRHVDEKRPAAIS